jgi:hypothetical protein
MKVDAIDSLAWSVATDSRESIYNMISNALLEATFIATRDTIGFVNKYAVEFATHDVVDIAADDAVSVATENAMERVTR